MLTITAARKPRKRSGSANIGLAVAGGGPIGGMYEVGALFALEESIAGLDLNALEVYVGVSSGAFVGAALANGLSTAEIGRIFITGESDAVTFKPEIFMRPAFFEYARRVTSVPRLMLDWIGSAVRNPFEVSLADLMVRFGAVLPTGLFDNAAIERFLRETFTAQGRSNDFRTLGAKLFIVAVELDSGQLVRFGAPGFDAVPISRAIEASAALPGLYPPVEIDGKFYVDGALKRTLHASVALDAGADFVIGINPLVPFDVGRAMASGGAPASLTAGGLPAVLSQAFRSLLQSRMQTGHAKYEHDYEHADLALLEPDADDAEMFFTNVFSYATRRRVAEHAYEKTRADLREKRDALTPLLARNGLTLREDVLEDASRSLIAGLAAAPRRTVATAQLHRTLDELGAAISAPTRAVKAKRGTRTQRDSHR